MKRTSQYPNDADEAARALIDAGFKPGTATLIATANRWLVVFTVIVSVAALAWIGVHLWPDLDAETWQDWADRNPGFFEPLDVGATVGIVPDLHGHMGLLIRRVPQGVQVERRLWFPFDEVPVGLVVKPEAAERVLRLDVADRSFWNAWQAIAEDGGIHVYQHLRRGSPYANGYRVFLQRLHDAGTE